MIKIYFTACLLLICVSGCGDREGADLGPDTGNTAPPNNSTDWLIPVNQVLDGGPGKDGIPALLNPNMIKAEAATYLSDDDLILGYVDGKDARAYPHRILDWHEIINEDFENVSVAVIYCPLTGTGIGWDRKLKAGKTTFGVSGLLYNTNVIPYDRATNTNWSQLLLLAVNGELSGTKPDPINLTETTWKTWREMYPDTRVVSTATGFSRNYSKFPYGDYRTNHNAIFFPVSKKDPRLPAKERVLTVIRGNKAKAYSIENFTETNSLIQDKFDGIELAIVGNKARNYIVSFDRKLPDGSLLDFEVIQNGGPVILKDQEGNQWDITGQSVSGPRKGQKLKSQTQMMGYWFAWAPFYESLELYVK